MPNTPHARDNAPAPTEISLEALVATAKAHDAESARTPHDAKRGLLVLVAGRAARDRRKAAETTAKLLGKPLVVVDLHDIVSKYIGETEKNLDMLFDSARTSEAALYFDEADALFGKRTEVKDSHDRYANLEVSYLLAKIEAHPGLAMLSSNLKSSIDPAITKRLRYIVALS